MRYILYFIFAVICFGINFGVFGMMSFFGTVPNIPLLLVIIVALFEDKNDYIIFSLFGGLTFDFYSGLFPGSFTLAFLILGTLIQQISKHILDVNSRAIYLPLFLFLGLALTDVWIWIFSSFTFAFHFWVLPIHLQYFFKTFAPSFIYNLILIYPLYAIWIILQDYLVGFEKNRQTIR